MKVWVQNLTGGLLLTCVALMSSVESLLVTTYVSNSLEGIAASSRVLSRHTRELGIPKGTSIAIKWSLDFPIRGVTRLVSALQITHLVKIPLSRIYPDQQEIKRIDDDLVHYIDQELLQKLMENGAGLDRMGLPSPAAARNETLSAHSPVEGEGAKGVFGPAKNIPSDAERTSNYDTANIYHIQSNHIPDDSNSLHYGGGETSDGYLDTKFSFLDILRQDRRKSREDRLIVYRDLQSLFEKMGLPGKDCLLRTICEIGHLPFDDSLFGELFNILMMPSLGGRREYTCEDPSYDDFVEAELYGRRVRKCHKKYAKCPVSFFFFIYDIFEKMFM